MKLNNDFLYQVYIDSKLDSIWKWLGFYPCKVVLEKHFTKDIDYKIITNKIYEENFAPEVAGAPRENVVKAASQSLLWFGN